MLHADAVQVHLHKLDAINHALAAMQWHITDEYVMLSGAQTLRSLVYNNGTNRCTGGLTGCNSSWRCLAAPAKETLVEGGGLEFLLTVFHSRLPSMIRATAAQALANAACKSGKTGLCACLTILNGVSCSLLLSLQSEW